jgi:membrane associated rhomboid family serine protease
MVLIAVVALALCVVIALAVAGFGTEAIVTAIGGVVSGTAAGFVVKRRNDANIRAKQAIEDAKQICGPTIAGQLAS